MVRQHNLKELVQKYSLDQILRALKKYNLYFEDFISLSTLIREIEKAQTESHEEGFVFFVGKLRNQPEREPFFFAGIKKRNKNYKLTYKNTRQIDKLASYIVPIQEEDYSESINKLFGIEDPELYYLVIVLLSINAFMPKVIDTYFDGKIEDANASEYIGNLITFVLAAT